MGNGMFYEILVDLSFDHRHVRLQVLADVAKGAWRSDKDHFMDGLRGELSL